MHAYRIYVRRSHFKQPLWTMQGLNLRPSDYESAALTNWAKGPFEVGHSHDQYRRLSTINSNYTYIFISVMTYFCRYYGYLVVDSMGLEPIMPIGSSPMHQRKYHLWGHKVALPNHWIYCSPVSFSEALLLTFNWTIHNFVVWSGFEPPYVSEAQRCVSCSPPYSRDDWV